MKLFENETISLPQAEITYIPNFLPVKTADTLFKKIYAETNWRADEITVFGKTYKQPRLTALFSETSTTYSYSNITIDPEPFPLYLQELKRRVENVSKDTFNTVFLNLYRDGKDSNGWHADNEKELGKNPVIASLSLGAIRAFHFKHRFLTKERYKLPLLHGSLLLMKGEMQHYWLHQIAKTKKPIEPRINLTFRNLIP